MANSLPRWPALCVPQGLKRDLFVDSLLRDVSGLRFGYDRETRTPTRPRRVRTSSRDRPKPDTRLERVYSYKIPQLTNSEVLCARKTPSRVTGFSPRTTSLAPYLPPTTKPFTSPRDRACPRLENSEFRLENCDRRRLSEWTRREDDRESSTSATRDAFSQWLLRTPSRECARVLVHSVSNHSGNKKTHNAKVGDVGPRRRASRAPCRESRRRWTRAGPRRPRRTRRRRPRTAERTPAGRQRGASTRTPAPARTPNEPRRRPKGFSLFYSQALLPQSLRKQPFLRSPF